MVMQVMALLSMLLSAVLVMNTLTAIITQQTNQIGIIKAVGGSSRTVLSVYLVGVLHLQLAGAGGLAAAGHLHFLRPDTLVFGLLQYRLRAI